MALSVRFTGQWCLVAALTAAPCWCAQPLAVRIEGGVLRVSARDLRFLAGGPLERLRNGASVVYSIQLTLLVDRKSTVVHRTAARFAVSYDLWEEKYAVTRLGKPPKSVTHLSATAAEAWCLDNITARASGLSPDSPFWIRLEVRAEDSNHDFSSEEDEGFSLARLVELFSRPPAKEQPQWQREAGPIRLRDLQ